MGMFKSRKSRKSREDLISTIAEKIAEKSTEMVKSPEDQSSATVEKPQATRPKISSKNSKTKMFQSRRKSREKARENIAEKIATKLYSQTQASEGFEDARTRA